LVLVGLLGLAASRGLWWGGGPAAAAARKLRDGDPPTRIVAIGELVRFGQEDPGVALPALRGALKDGEPAVRAAATQALVPVVGSTGRNAAAQPEVRRAVADLLEILSDRVVEVRTSGIGALTMIAVVWQGPDGVVDRPGIRDALLGAAADPDAAVRIAAVRGLGVIGPKLADDPPPALLTALEDDTDGVRMAAAEALAGFRKGLSRSLPARILSFEKARRGRERGPTSAPAGGTDPTLTPDDGAWWSSGPGSSKAREPALTAARTLLRALPESGSPDAPPIEAASFEALAEVLRSGAPEVRATVAYALGRFRPTPAVVPVLGRAVRDPDAAVRAAALKALHDIADRIPFAPPEALQAALADEAPAVRYWAAGALGHIQLGLDPYIAELLRLAEHDPDLQVRAVCGHEIEDMVRPTAVTPAIVPVLTRALDRPDPSVRRAALAFLTRLGPATAPAIPRLRELAQSPDPDLKEAAREALRQLKAAD
jgi:HEAT repeat protein